METAITLNNVGKKFSRTLRRTMMYGAQDVASSMVGIMPRTHELRPGEFWAVDGVNLELERGDSLGIIGPNGSGKTTLLRMINGIFMPDTGSIEVKGKVGGLIHVGAGFHPMLTGRENIYINGAILGMSTREITKKFDAIVDFADIGDFLDSPVRQYSSGMYVRLGFAVAVHSDPDILLVDEVLAVGDRDFSLKCYQKMQEIRERGATIVLVSHNEYVIRERSRRAIYLRNGKPVFLGSSEEAISRYIRDDLDRKAARVREQMTVGPARPQAATKAEVLGVRFLNQAGEETTSLATGSPLQVEVSFHAAAVVQAPVFAVSFYTENGLVYGANSSYENVAFPDLKPGDGRVVLQFPQFHLPTDTYYISVLIAEKNPCDLLDCRHFAYTLVVDRAPDARGGLKLPVSWRMEGV